MVVIKVWTKSAVIGDAAGNAFELLIDIDIAPHQHFTAIKIIAMLRDM